MGEMAMESHIRAPCKDEPPGTSASFSDGVDVSGPVVGMEGGTPSWSQLPGVVFERCVLREQCCDRPVQGKAARSLCLCC